MKTQGAGDFGVRAIRLATAVQNVVNRLSNVGTAFPGLAICGVCRLGHDRGEGIYTHGSNCPIEELEKALADFNPAPPAPKKRRQP